jgi:uncharacterized protein (TIGR02996 family)
MNRREFNKAIAAKEHDDNLRAIFADWLDDQGEHEEAQRERGWLSAKQWLVLFAKKHSTEYKEYSYDDLLEFGRRAGENEGEAKIHFRGEMWDALTMNLAEFWTNWSIVTGLPSPEIPKDRGFHHWACCSHEIYHWFGPPPAPEPYPEDVDE